MRALRTIVVDDESEARDGLISLLDSLPEFNVIDTCSNGLEAINIIESTQIDLAFLDIQMPLVDGFDVIRSISKDKLPMVIFITAHDEYTLKAFEVNALDYLLKPFSNERFYEACNRALELFKLEKAQEHVEKLSVLPTKIKGESGLISTSRADKFIFKENGQVFFLDHSKINWIEAFDYYVKIHISDKFHIVRTSMKKLEEGLPNVSFIRIHKSSIINKSEISSIVNRGGEMKVILRTGSELKVSRTYKDAVKALL